MDFVNTVGSFIAEQGLFEPGAPVVVACSGGPDSIALLRCLHALGHPVAVAHVNYGLRGEDADGDEQFVEDTCRQLGVACFVKKADSEALKHSPNSLQADARKIRYRFFEEVLHKTGYRYCATGHTADDQAETILLSLMRGAGPAIMHGIPAKRDAYVRPLLSVNRAAILEYLESISQGYRVDATNAGDAYLRNRIRNEVMPSLNRIHPKAAERLILQQDHYDQESQFISQILKPFIQQAQNNTLNWDSFVDQYGDKHLPLLVSHVLAYWGISGPGNRAGVSLIQNQVGTGIFTTKGRLERVRGGIMLREEMASGTIKQVVIDSIDEQMHIDLGERTVKLAIPKNGNPDFTRKGIHYLNVDEIVFPLQFRAWRQGDRMQPLGMRGEKLLSDIFIDEKFSTQQKEKAIVVEDQLGIICLSEFRIAHRVKLQQGVERFVSLKFL